MTPTELDIWLKDALAAFPAAALLLADLDSGVLYHSINPAVQFPAAALLALPIALYALEQMRKGALAPEQSVALGDGAEPLQALLRRMLRQGDGTATEAVVRCFRRRAMQDYIHDTLGLHDTLGPRETDCQRGRSTSVVGRTPLTSAQDQYRLYRQLDDGSVLTEPLRAFALESLAHRSHGDLPDGCDIIHMTATGAEICHDAGLLLLPGRRCFLGLFTWGGTVSAARRAQMDAITQAICTCYGAAR